MTQGHHPTHTGLQKHSVGDIYPLAIVGVGDKWQLHNLETGEVFYNVSTGEPVSCPRRPSGVLFVYNKWVAGKSCFDYAFVPPYKPKAGAPSRADTTVPACPPSRANWYGEQGTDPVQTEADLPPAGHDGKLSFRLTVDEGVLIDSYRKALPISRNALQILARKAAA